MYLENLKDEGKYPFTEQIEVREEFIERLKWVKRGIGWFSSLTKPQKKIITLRLIDEKTFDCIAKELNISKPTVTNHFKKALKRGAAFISDEEDHRKLIYLLV